MMTAQVVRLRKFEKPPEQLLKDLSEHQDWKEVVVVGTYIENDVEYIDAWYSAGNASTLIGMLMRGILHIDAKLG